MKIIFQLVFFSNLLLSCSSEIVKPKSPSSSSSSTSSTQYGVFNVNEPYYGHGDAYSTFTSESESSTVFPVGSVASIYYNLGKEIDPNSINLNDFSLSQNGCEFAKPYLLVPENNPTGIIFYVVHDNINLPKKCVLTQTPYASILNTDTSVNSIQASSVTFSELGVHLVFKEITPSGNVEFLLYGNDGIFIDFNQLQLNTQFSTVLSMSDTGNDSYLIVVKPENGVSNITLQAGAGSLITPAGELSNVSNMVQVNLQNIQGIVYGSTYSGTGIDSNNYITLNTSHSENVLGNPITVLYKYNSVINGHPQLVVNGDCDYSFSDPVLNSSGNTIGHLITFTPDISETKCIANIVGLINEDGSSVIIPENILTWGEVLEKTREPSTMLRFSAKSFHLAIRDGHGSYLGAVCSTWDYRTLKIQDATGLTTYGILTDSTNLCGATVTGLANGRHDDIRFLREVKDCGGYASAITTVSDANIVVTSNVITSVQGVTCPQTSLKVI